MGLLHSHRAKLENCAIDWNSTRIQEGAGSCRNPSYTDGNHSFTMRNTNHYLPLQHKRQRHTYIFIMDGGSRVEVS